MMNFQKDKVTQLGKLVIYIKILAKYVSNKNGRRKILKGENIVKILLNLSSKNIFKYNGIKQADQLIPDSESLWKF